MPKNWAFFLDFSLLWPTCVLNVVLWSMTYSQLIRSNKNTSKRRMFVEGTVETNGCNKRIKTKPFNGIDVRLRLIYENCNRQRLIRVIFNARQQSHTSWVPAYFVYDDYWFIESLNLPTDLSLSNRIASDRHGKWPIEW